MRGDTLARVCAVALATIGVGMTSAGTLGHLPWLDAPGASAILVGACWLGIILARGDESTKGHEGHEEVGVEGRREQ